MNISDREKNEWKKKFKTEKNRISKILEYDFTSRKINEWKKEFRTETNNRVICKIS